MRGHILGVEDGHGVLLGANEERRRFPLSEWKAPGAPVSGQWVDYLPDGEGARAVYPLPGGAPMAAAAPTSSSVVFGAIGTGCLALGLIIPFLPTIAAFVFGVIGASRARDERDETGLVLSRIAWIGAVVMLGLGVLVLATLALLFGGIFTLWLSHGGPLIST